MCNLWFAYSSLRIKRTFVECGKHRYRRLVSQVDGNKRIKDCDSFQIKKCAWSISGDENDHSKAEEAMDTFLWAAEVDALIREGGKVSKDLVRFNWEDDFELLSTKLEYETEQNAEFWKLVEGDPYAKALLDGVDPRVVMKE